MVKHLADFRVYGQRKKSRSQPKTLAPGINQKITTCLIIFSSPRRAHLISGVNDGLFGMEQGTAPDRLGPDLRPPDSADSAGHVTITITNETTDTPMTNSEGLAATTTANTTATTTTTATATTTDTNELLTAPINWGPKAPINGQQPKKTPALRRSIWRGPTVALPPTQNPTSSGSKSAREWLLEAYKAVTMAATLDPQLAEGPLFIKGLLDGKKGPSLAALEAKIDRILSTKGPEKVKEKSYSSALQSQPVQVPQSQPKKSPQGKITAATTAAPKETKGKEKEKAPNGVISTASGDEWHLVTKKTQKPKASPQKRAEKPTPQNKPKGLVLTGVSAFNPMAVRDTINKALGYIGVISVSRTFKGNLLLVPNPQGKKQPLSDRQSVWLPALRSLPGLEVAKIPDQEQWFKLVAHGVPVRPFSMGNAFDEDLFKSEVFTFNQIEVIGKPRWLADPTGKGKLAASVAFAVPSQTVANKALEKGLYIAGEKVTVQVLKGYSNRTQCFECQGFVHDPLSCRKRACRF